VLLASGPEPFYGSLVFWSVTTLAAIVLAGLGTILFPYAFGARRRLLIYGVELSAPLLSRMGTGLSDLKITLGDVPLVNPRTVALRVENRSRQDIGSADFDQGKPLVLDVGSKIIGMGSSSSPVHPQPVIAADGSQDRQRVQCPPDAVGRRQDRGDGREGHRPVSEEVLQTLHRSPRDHRYGGLRLYCSEDCDDHGAPVVDDSPWVRRA
jgi:hypothetical protein